QQQLVLLRRDAVTADDVFAVAQVAADAEAESGQRLELLFAQLCQRVLIVFRGVLSVRMWCFGGCHTLIISLHDLSCYDGSACGSWGNGAPASARCEDKEEPFVTILAQHPVQPCTAQPVPHPRGAGKSPARKGLSQRVSYQDPGTALLAVGGEIDAGTAPRFDEML